MRAVAGHAHTFRFAAQALAQTRALSYRAKREPIRTELSTAMSTELERLERKWQKAVQRQKQPEDFVVTTVGGCR